MKLALETAAQKAPEIAQAIGAKVPTKDSAEQSVKPKRNFRVPFNEKIKWTADERLAVARKWNEIVEANKANKDVTLTDCLDSAQLVLPVGRRRQFKAGATKSMYYMEFSNLRAALSKDDGHAIEFETEEEAPDPVPAPAPATEAAQHAIKQAQANSSKYTVKVGTELPIVPVRDIGAAMMQNEVEFPIKSSAPSPAPVEMPPPPPTTLGPLEMALQQMVGQAVGATIGTLVAAMREEQEKMRQEFQHLLTEQYDALMSYWDPEYKKLREAHVAFVPDWMDKSHIDKLGETRIRPKQVLVSGGQTDQFHPLRLHFKGIEFTFIDGREHRKVSAGGWYDLVICTKYTNHGAVGTLKRLHGNKVVMVDGAINNVIAIIKNWFKL